MQLLLARMAAGEEASEKGRDKEGKGAELKDGRFERQVRLWGKSGQQRIDELRLYAHCYDACDHSNSQLLEAVRDSLVCASLDLRFHIRRYDPCNRPLCQRCQKQEADLPPPPWDLPAPQAEGKRSLGKHIDWRIDGCMKGEKMEIHLVAGSLDTLADVAAKLRRSHTYAQVYQHAHTRTHTHTLTSSHSQTRPHRGSSTTEERDAGGDETWPIVIACHMRGDVGMIRRLSHLPLVVDPHVPPHRRETAEFLSLIFPPFVEPTLIAFLDSLLADDRSEDRERGSTPLRLPYPLVALKCRLALEKMQSLQAQQSCEDKESFPMSSIHRQPKSTLRDSSLVEAQRVRDLCERMINHLEGPFTDAVRKDGVDPRCVVETLGKLREMYEIPLDILAATYLPSSWTAKAKVAGLFTCPSHKHEIEKIMSNPNLISEDSFFTSSQIAPDPSIAQGLQAVLAKIHARQLQFSRHETGSLVPHPSSSGERSCSGGQPNIHCQCNRILDVVASCPTTYRVLGSPVSLGVTDSDLLPPNTSDSKIALSTTSKEEGDADADTALTAFRSIGGVTGRDGDFIFDQSAFALAFLSLEQKALSGVEKRSSVTAAGGEEHRRSSAFEEWTAFMERAEEAVSPPTISILGGMIASMILKMASHQFEIDDEPVLLYNGITNNISKF